MCPHGYPFRCGYPLDFYITSSKQATQKNARNYASSRPSFLSGTIEYNTTPSCLPSNKCPFARPVHIFGHPNFTSTPIVKTHICRLPPPPQMYILPSIRLEQSARTMRGERELEGALVIDRPIIPTCANALLSRAYRACTLFICFISSSSRESFPGANDEEGMEI